MTGFRRVSDRDLHQGFVWKVVRAEFEAPDGATFTRDIVRSPGAVGVVPVLFDPEGQPSVVLVRQYRPPYERELIEIPAGMRDIPGEPPIETGRRELIEEVGLIAGEISHLLDIFPSPGMTDSVTTILLATDLTPTDRLTQGPEEDASEVLHLSLDDALTLIEQGEISDAKTVAGLLMTARRLAVGSIR